MYQPRQAARPFDAQDTIDSLNTQIAEVPDLPAEATLDEQDARQAEIDALNSQIAEQQGLLDAVADAQETVDNLSEAPSLQKALESMANKPVDDDVVEWAEGVLAGKIDEMSQGSGRCRGRCGRDA